MFARPAPLARSIVGLALGFLVGSIAVADPQRLTVVALGDSITAAFNAEHYFADSPEVSWSTGERLVAGFESHLQKLQKMYRSSNITGYNYAVTGARAANLATQFRKANSVKPDYATLLIGANDVCHWPTDYQSSLDKFVDDLKENLDSMVAANPKVKVTISAIPDIYHVWELQKDDSSCQRVWSFIGLCKPLLSREATAAGREAFRERLNHANSSLANVAALYPQNVKFSDVASTYQFTLEDISRNDCFHPSTHGQNTISREIWNQSWFASQEFLLSENTQR